MYTQTYLFFEGNCEDAINFYKNAIGASVEMLLRYKESPDPQTLGMVPAGSENKVMHATFRVGDTLIMASDGRCSGHTNFQGFSLSLSVATPADADRAFAALSEGGKVDMPLSKTFWSPRFGMLTDRFGVRWMVAIAQ